MLLYAVAVRGAYEKARLQDDGDDNTAMLQFRVGQRKKYKYFSAR
jgi:hypothetical protein